MTDHQREARRRYAEICRRPETDWYFVSKPDPLCWYDFFDPETGRYGQCLLGRDGRWVQRPLGGQPVILAIWNVRPGSPRSSFVGEASSS